MPNPLLRPRRRTRLMVRLSILAGFTAVVASAAEPNPIVDQPQSVATPEQDDAALHDVCFIDSQHGWTVGDRGAIWRTQDAGATWEFIPCATQESLRGVTFSDERHGWIVGAGTKPFTQQPIGFVLATQDGGATWQDVCHENLPRLKHVQFFDAERGVAIGEANSTFPNGTLMTVDGGRSWLPISGPVAEGWNTAVFITPDFGVLGGRRGVQTTVTQGGMNAPSSPSSLRAYHAASIDFEARRIWLAGDGGLIFRSDDAGRSWVNVGQNLPREAPLLFDFHALASAGGHVWAAGSPGSVIWHSADAGATWTPLPTPETTPIHAMTCVDGHRVVAVGALGKIMMSEADGQTWRTLRGANRRLAALDLHAHVQRTSFLGLTREAGNRGYRIGNWTLVRRDIGDVQSSAADLEQRFSDAFVAAGGTGVEIDWRLPVAIPGLDRQQAALLSEWSTLTDQNLEDVLVTVIAAKLRMWRPEVLLLDDPPKDDYPTQMLRAALTRAIDLAGKESQDRYSRFWNVSNLPAWRPSRAFEQRPPGSDGAPVLDPFEWQPRSQASLVTTATEHRSRLDQDLTALQQPEAWTEIRLLDPSAAEDAASLAVHRDFFQDLPLKAGGEARRELPPLSQGDQEQLFEAARRQRTFAALSQKMLNETGGGDQLLGQLSEMTRGLPPRQAALQLASLANDYRSRGNWDAAEATLMELATTYPDQPIAQAEMLWLLKFWTCQELEWQRLRETSAAHNFVEPASTSALDPMEAGPRPVTLAGGTVQIGDLQSVLSTAGRAISQDVAGGQAMGRHQLDRQKRNAQAGRVLSLLQQTTPEALTGPTMQMLQVALLRRQNKHQEADKILTDLASGNGVWARAARGELWLLQPQVQPLQSVYVSRRVDEPPNLDGVLSDVCWDACAEMRLSAEGRSDALVPLFGDEQPSKRDAGSDRRPANEGAFCLIAHDSRYLYFAANAARQSTLPKDGPAYAGRPYDGDLLPFDRFSLAFDVNRDYSSFYRLDIDQRGWTRDACWEHQPWNPRWHVACDADDKNWRIEAAIPWEELVSAPPERGAVWAIGVMRTMPGIGRQSWQWPTSNEFRPEGFGLLQFD